MKHINSQSGFSALDTVLAVVLVAAIGAASYFAFHTMHDSQGSSVASVSPLPHATPSPSYDPATAGWKTYTSSYENSSFKYPANWTLKQEQGTDPNAKDVTVTLTSPHGLTLKYQEAVSGIGGGCPAGSPNIVLTKAQSVPAIKGPQPVWLAENTSGIGLDGLDTFKHVAPPDLDTGQCGLFFVMTSKAHSNTYISFGTDVGMSSTNTTVPSATQRQDYPTAEQILESFRY